MTFSIADLNPNYRPDIDGLRAIAVLSVILFHINKALIPGGFVGVDIFFVISGFLISRNILQELEHGKFSIVDFYRSIGTMVIALSRKRVFLVKPRYWLFCGYQRRNAAIAPLVAWCRGTVLHHLAVAAHRCLSAVACAVAFRGSGTCRARIIPAWRISLFVHPILCLLYVADTSRRTIAGRNCSACSLERIQAAPSDGNANGCLGPLFVGWLTISAFRGTGVSRVAGDSADTWDGTVDFRRTPRKQPCVPFYGI